MRFRFSFLLPFFLVLATFVSSVSGASQLQEYCNTGDNDGWSVFGSSNWAAQTFVAVGVHSVTSIKLKCYRVGIDVGDMIVSLRAVDGSSKPTGADLTVSAPHLNASEFTTNTNGFWYEWNVSSYVLTDGVKYAIVARCPSTGGGINRSVWRIGDDPIYGYGGLVRSSDGGSTWTLFNDYDGMFEIWGQTDVGEEGWYSVPLYSQFVVLFVLTGLPAVVLSLAGAKQGWGLEGLLFGGFLGLGVGVIIGVVPFWLVFLLGLFMVLLLFRMVKK